MSNIVFIATSLDGYISAADGNLDWLESVPNPQQDDLGFNRFINRVDAVVMGRRTFETVLGFGQGWQYPVPGIVLSSTLDALPGEFGDQVQLANGNPRDIVRLAYQQGFKHLYIDGGKTIQLFLREDMIDELIITEIPLLLGGGDKLFDTLEQPLAFELIDTEVLLEQLVVKHYQRNRNNA